MNKCEWCLGTIDVKCLGPYNGQTLYRCRCCGHYFYEFDKSSHKCNHWILPRDPRNGVMEGGRVIYEAKNKEKWKKK